MAVVQLFISVYTHWNKLDYTTGGVDTWPTLLFWKYCQCFCPQCCSLPLNTTAVPLSYGTSVVADDQTTHNEQCQCDACLCIYVCVYVCNVLLFIYFFGKLFFWIPLYSVCFKRPCILNNRPINAGQLHIEAPAALGVLNTGSTQLMNYSVVH